MLIGSMVIGVTGGLKKKFLMISIGMFIAGPVSEIIGICNWMISAGIPMLTVGLLCYFSTRRFDETTPDEAIVKE